MSPLREDGRRRRLLARGDVTTVRVPVAWSRPDARTLALAVAHAGRRDGRPVLLVLPGGPGLASIVPGRRLRARAEGAGFRVLMPEHRGIGCSRTDERGRPLGAEAMWLEWAVRDALAVLDAEGVERAYVLGSSYGGYLAQGIAARAPDRVAGLILDSTAPAARYDERDHQRALFWEGRAPATREIAELVRSLHARGVPDEELTSVVPPVFELLGPRALRALLRRRRAGDPGAWRATLRVVGGELTRLRSPFLYEGDIASTIWFREIYALEPDGAPFDPARLFAPLRRARFAGLDHVPFDFEGVLGHLRAPVRVLVGARDARTPPEATAALAAASPHVRVLRVRGAGHDLSRTRTGLVLRVARELTGRAGRW